MSTRVCLLRGDGIGDELLPFARDVLAALAPELELVEERIGLASFRASGSALPPAALEAARAADACLLVAITSPLTPLAGYKSPIVALRRELDLFANLRPVASPPPGSPARRAGTPDVDLLIVRENTEGLYSGRERRDGDTATCERVITRAASERIARVAGEHARARRGRVCVVHKSNVLRETCGLFREAALGALATIDGVAAEELLVDHAAYLLASDPARFDVLVTTNLFGDVLSDLAAHAGGGLGLVASANVGSRHALFEPVHGSAPAIAGRGIANPLATLRASAMLLAHVGARDASRALDAAIDATLVAGPWTADLGGSAPTAAVVDAVLERALTPAS